MEWLSTLRVVVFFALFGVSILSRGCWAQEVDWNAYGPTMTPEEVASTDPTTTKPSANTVINLTAGNQTQPIAYINLVILKKPHNLFVGRCTEEDVVLHKENIILNNDGKSHVGGVINIKLNGPALIKCVKIFDLERDGNGAYPSYVNGGVGFDYIQFRVSTTYGRGFKFYVEIYGQLIKAKHNLLTE